MLQFGYLVMFAAACPLVALVMFVSNVIELRLDAIKLLRYLERTVPERAAGVGIWSSILNMLFLCALITNVSVVMCSLSTPRTALVLGPTVLFVLHEIHTYILHSQSVYIAFTSNIFPKLLWISQIPTWDGYINAGASTFLGFTLHNATDLDNGQFCWCA